MPTSTMQMQIQKIVKNFFSNSNLLTIPKDMKAYMEKAETYYNGLIGKNNVQWD